MRDYMCMKIMTLRASTNLLLRGASRVGCRSPHRGASVTVCRKLRCVHPQPRRLMACQNT